MRASIRASRGTHIPFRSGACELCQPIEARLLLAAQRGIELIQCRLHQFGCLHHGLEPLLHRLQPSDRRERHVVRAGGLQLLNGLLRRRAQAVERFLLRARRAYHGLDPFDRQVGQAGLRIAAGIGLRVRVLLRLALRTLADIGAERIETCLLLVAERVIEFLQRRPHDLHGLERSADAVRHRPQSTRRRHRVRVAARSLEHIGSPCGRAPHLVEQCALLGRRLYSLHDRSKRPGGDALFRIFAQLPEGPWAHAQTFAHARTGGYAAGLQVLSRTYSGVGGIIWTLRAPEHGVDEVVVSVGPVAAVVRVGPERVIENVGIGIRPEHGAKPRYKRRAQAALPGVAMGPAVVPALPCRKDQRIGIAAEALSKSSTCGCLHRGSDGGARSRRLYSQELLTSQNALLHALRAQAFRLLRLQLLHALLQPIDALLVLHALAREHLALPLLGDLLELLHAPLALEQALFCLQQPLLRTLRLRTLRLLRLQLLHALL